MVWVLENFLENPIGTCQVDSRERVWTQRTVENSPEAWNGKWVWVVNFLCCVLGGASDSSHHPCGGMSLGSKVGASPKRPAGIDGFVFLLWSIWNSESIEIRLILEGPHSDTGAVNYHKMNHILTFWLHYKGENIYLTTSISEGGKEHTLKTYPRGT